MPKPRNCLTPFKHFGTIVAHPVMYGSYLWNKRSFVREDHLALHPDFHNERDDPNHPYPDAKGSTIREAGVIYPSTGGLPDETLVKDDIHDHRPYDHQAQTGMNRRVLGPDRHVMLVLRQEETRGTTLRAAQKRGAHQDEDFDDIGRTQHTTLTGGANVASAALFAHDLKAPRVIMSSGHYQPDDAAAAKLAIYGKLTGTVNRRALDFYNHDETSQVPMTMKRRMQIVWAWSEEKRDKKS